MAPLFSLQLSGIVVCVCEATNRERYAWKLDTCSGRMMMITGEVQSGPLLFDTWPVSELMAS